jgi:hypothetical protein
MDASPLLARVVAALVQQRLDVVLIGNAAAAMHSAPVTTLDFDFMFRDTPTNLRKLKVDLPPLNEAAFGARIRMCEPGALTLLGHVARGGDEDPEGLHQWRSSAETLGRPIGRHDATAIQMGKDGYE